MHRDGIHELYRTTVDPKIMIFLLEATKSRQLFERVIDRFSPLLPYRDIAWTDRN